MFTKKKGDVTFPTKLNCQSEQQIISSRFFFFFLKFWFFRFPSSGGLLGPVVFVHFHGFHRSRLAGCSHCCEPSFRRHSSKTWRERRCGGVWVKWWMDVCDVWSQSVLPWTPPTAGARCQPAAQRHAGDETPPSLDENQATKLFFCLLFPKVGKKMFLLLVTHSASARDLK